MTMIMRSRMVYVRPPAADCCPRCYQKTQPRWHLGAAICHSRSQTMKNTVESACLCEKLTWKAESMRANSWHKLSRQLRSKADWTQPHAVRFSQQVIPRIYTENVILAYSTIMNYMHTHRLSLLSFTLINSPDLQVITVMSSPAKCYPSLLSTSVSPTVEFVGKW